MNPKRFILCRVVDACGLHVLADQPQVWARRASRADVATLPAHGKRWGRPGARGARMFEVVTGTGYRFVVDKNIAFRALRPFDEFAHPGDVVAELEHLEAVTWQAANHDIERPDAFERHEALLGAKRATWARRRADEDLVERWRRRQC